MVCGEYGCPSFAQLLRFLHTLYTVHQCFPLETLPRLDYLGRHLAQLFKPRMGGRRPRSQDDIARVPAAPNDVIACGVHTSVNPAGTSRIWRHPPEISSSSVCVCVWANSVATDRHPSPPPARQQRTPRLAKQTRIDDRSGSGKWGTGVTTPGSHEVPWLHFVGWFSRASECDPRVAGSPVALRFCGEIRISSQKRGALEYHSVSHALGAPRQGRSRVLRSGL